MMIRTQHPIVRALLLGAVLLLVAGCAGGAGVTGVGQPAATTKQGDSGSAGASVAPSQATIAAWGIPFRWVDFSAGTLLALTGDDAFIGIALPFPVNLMDDRTMFTSAFVSTNGLVTFGVGNDEYANVAFPTTDIPARAVAPLWDDWVVNNPGGGFPWGVWTRTVGTAPNREFWIYWVNVEHHRCGNVERLTFAAVLYEERRHVDFYYLDADVEPGVPSGTCGDNGNSATVGIQAFPRADQFSFNTASIPSGFGVRTGKVR